MSSSGAAHIIVGGGHNVAREGNRSGGIVAIGERASCTIGKMMEEVRDPLGYRR